MNTDTNATSSQPSDDSDRITGSSETNRGEYPYQFPASWKGPLAKLNLAGKIEPGQYSAGMSLKHETVTVTIHVSDADECLTVICFRRKHNAGDSMSLLRNNASMIGYRGYVDRLREDIENAVDGLDAPGAVISDKLREALVRTLHSMNTWESQKYRREL